MPWRWRSPGTWPPSSTRSANGALELFERALALNPNSALSWGLSGITLCYLGEPKAALDREAYALRLNPLDPLGFYYTGVSGWAAMLCGKYDEALVFGFKARRENPRWSVNLRFLAATLVHVGRLEEARQIAGSSSPSSHASRSPSFVGGIR